MSIGIQTEQNEEYPSYNVIQGMESDLLAPMPMFFNIADQKHIHPCKS